MNNKERKIIFHIAIVFFILISACKPYHFRSNYTDVNKLIHSTQHLPTKPFLKTHLKNGNVCIMQSSWQVNTPSNYIFGRGILYDYNRTKILEGNVTIPIDSIAIFETNDKLKGPNDGIIKSLSIIAVANILLGVYCISVPKACFGSCPTFYIKENDNFHYADAEGFSNAISPSMEYADIDALDNSAISDNLFSLTMKNEALETHCVKEIKLLAYPRKKGQRIYQSSLSEFYLCENNYSLNKAVGNEGDISGLLQNNDYNERFSFADDKNLNSKEEIYFDFYTPKNKGDLGLIINFRQTLLPTYLFYSAMGYMGDQVSDVFAMLENKKEIREKFDTTSKLLGGIDVFWWNVEKNNWDFQSTILESGPIAINKQIILLKKNTPDSIVKLKLVMNKGLWRIDYLALTNIIEKVVPFYLSPVNIMNKNIIDSSALESLNCSEKYLVTMPGSEYKFNFILPSQNEDYELFLYSKGYYLEWMREHWLNDKNLLKLKKMIKKPHHYLKQEAKEFKRIERKLEFDFWNSRIDTKKNSFYEN